MAAKNYTLIQIQEQNDIGGGEVKKRKNWLKIIVNNSILILCGKLKHRIGIEYTYYKIFDSEKHRMCGNIEL